VKTDGRPLQIHPPRPWAGRYLTKGTSGNVRDTTQAEAEMPFRWLATGRGTIHHPISLSAALRIPFEYTVPTSAPHFL